MQATKLTRSNLDELAAKARSHTSGYDSPPETTTECRDRIKANAGKREKAAYAWIFGPEDSYLRSTEYGELVGLGLCDGVVWSPDERGVMRGGDVDREYERLRTIEQELARLLEQHPEDRYDVIVALHDRTVGDWSDLKDDPEGTIYLERAETTPVEYHQAGFDAEEKLTNEMKARAFANSGLATPEVCYECGGTVGVEPGGMGCSRCNS